MSWKDPQSSGCVWDFPWKSWNPSSYWGSPMDWKPAEVELSLPWKTCHSLGRQSGNRSTSLELLWGVGKWHWRIPYKYYYYYCCCLLGSQSTIGWCSIATFDYQEVLSFVTGFRWPESNWSWFPATCPPVTTWKIRAGLSPWQVLNPGRPLKSRTVSIYLNFSRKKTTMYKWMGINMVEFHGFSMFFHIIGSATTTNIHLTCSISGLSGGGA